MIAPVTAPITLADARGYGVPRGSPCRKQRRFFPPPVESPETRANPLIRSSRTRISYDFQPVEACSFRHAAFRRAPQADVHVADVPRRLRIHPGIEGCGRGRSQPPHHRGVSVRQQKAPGTRHCPGPSPTAEITCSTGARRRWSRGCMTIAAIGSRGGSWWVAWWGGDSRTGSSSGSGWSRDTYGTWPRGSGRAFGFRTARALLRAWWSAQRRTWRPRGPAQAGGVRRRASRRGRVAAVGLVTAARENAASCQDRVTPRAGTACTTAATSPTARLTT